MKNTQKLTTVALIFLTTLGVLVILAIKLGEIFFSSTYNWVPTGKNENDYHTEIVAEGLSVPWAIVFPDKNTILVTERPGNIRIIDNGVLNPVPLLKVSDVFSSSESGLLDIELHPDFQNNKLLYIAYTHKNGALVKLRVSSYLFSEQKLTFQKIIIDDIPAGSFHDGARIAFGPDKKMYITTGDGSNNKAAQDLNNPAGKTLRLNDDGTIPEDNPFYNDQNVRKEIWAYGERNSQGIAWDNLGTMVQIDHGPSGFDGGSGNDEINIIEKGKNYGWPIIQGEQKKEGMEKAVRIYNPAVAPGGLAFYDKEMFPELKGYFLVGMLRGQTLVAVKIVDKKVSDELKIISDTYGRIREVVVADDGSIYFTTSNTDGRGNSRQNDDKIYKITRKE